jgi:hypothetical protein
MESLDGDWRVERESGLLPPGGVSKRIRGAVGVTRVLGIPVAPFRVVGDSLKYFVLPIRDELFLDEERNIRGRGLLWGLEFCRFKLVPRVAAH